MTAIKLIESLAIDTEYKIKKLAQEEIHDELTAKAEKEISEMLKKQGKFWCALIPAKDDEPDEEQDTPENDDDETKQQ